MTTSEKTPESILMPFSVKHVMERKGVGRPRDGDPEETRREILRAAERAFAAGGYSGATTRQIAGDAGVNVATLHYHFGGKEGLYRAVLADVSQGDLPSLGYPGPAPERLRRLTEELFDFSARRRFLSRLSLLDSLAGPTEASAHQKADDRRITHLSAALRELGGNHGSAQGEGAFSADETARIVVRLIDVAFVAEQAAVDREGGRDRGAIRSAVAAAALRLAGLA